MIKRVAGMVLGAVLTLASGSFATVPQEVGYQGYLTDGGGVPVSGSVTITFSLYATSIGGPPLWSENQTISIDKGIYSANLGAVTPLSLPFDTRYYLGIKIGDDPELSPRQPLASTPYAYRAKRVEAFDAGSVTDATISGTISGSKLGSHSHSATDITAGTVPDVRLSGEYTQALTLSNAGNFFTGSGANLTSLNASSLTSGSIPDVLLSAVQKKYGKVAVVAQSGGDYASPITAMNAIGTWCGIPSAANPCLLKIMPGIYSTGASSVVMQPYVNIKGSGESVTILSGSLNSQTSGLVVGANNAEISFLTVKNTGSGPFVTGLYNTVASPKMTNITIIASGANAVSYGVFNHSSSPEMNNVTVTATSAPTSYGVVNYTNSSPAMTNVTVTASGGNQAYGVHNSENSSPNMRNVIATASGGTDKNYGVYNTASSSPIMKNVTASGSGGSTSYGIYNSGGSSPVMSSFTASGSGGSANHGVYNDGGSSPAMSNVTASGSGGSYSHGVYNDGGSSPAMNNVTATASGGTISNYGVYNIGSSTMNNIRASASGGTGAYGVYNEGYSPNMFNVVVSVSGATSWSYGVYNANSSPIMNTVTGSASGAGICYGLRNFASSPKISNFTVTAKSGASNYGMFNTASTGTYTLSIDSSSLEGSTNSVYNHNAYTLKIGGSKLTGGPVNALGTYNCVGVYDGDTYTALGANCQ